MMLRNAIAGTNHKRGPFLRRKMRRDRTPVGHTVRAAALSLVSVGALVGCGPSPLESIGLRSSEWINEPTVPSTVPVLTTIPTEIPAGLLLWSNDVIPAANLEDPSAVIDSVFARREGDRFVQASRFEIASALPDVAFPGAAPADAEWVSSQLVFDNDGTLADDPSVAFGIWSAEPYTRSRSVAQMIVLRVSNDLEVANELATGAIEATCGLFSDRTTESCEIITVGSRDTWLLEAGGGTTLIWFEGPYRYELFGRTSVPVQTLRDMSAEMVPLASLGAEQS